MNNDPRSCDRNLCIVLHIYLSQYGYLTIKMSRTKKAHNAN